MTDRDPFAARRAHVLEHLRTQPRVVVALSGGVDSAALLTLAVEALGTGRVRSVTGRSIAVTEDEIADARRVAAELGVPHEVVFTRELENQEYLSNRHDRCYHCRSELFRILEGIAGRFSPSRVAYGAIADDLGDDRPGMIAAAEFGVLAPLLDARMTKADVRRVAREAGIHVASKPANACLASRIPTGVEVTPERLGQVARAETAIRHLGFPVVRVRHHGEIARIEVPLEDVARLSVPDLHARLRSTVAAAGFREHRIEPEGYRPGGARRPVAPVLYSIDPQAETGQ